jgi:hypothetical protein
LVSALLSGCALDHQHADHGDDDRGEEDVTPSRGSPRPGRRTANRHPTPPGADGPQAHRALTGRTVPVRLHQRETGWHDAGCRNPLQGTTYQQEGGRQAAGGGEGDQQGTDDAEQEADLNGLHAADTVCKPADDDDEDAGKECGDGHRIVHHAGIETEVLLHVRRNVEDRLCKKPECDDA